MIALYFLIPVVNAEMLNATTQLVIPTVAPSHEAKTDIETYSLTA